MSRPIYSKFVWADWDRKTRHLDPFAYTAYHRLCAFAVMVSSDFCSIPDDDRALARVSGLGMKRWLVVRASVLAFFELSATERVGDAGHLRYIHPRLKQDADVWLQHCEKQRNRRTAGTTGTPPEPHRNATNARSREKSEVRIEETTPLPPVAPDGAASDFLEAWTAYPHHGRRSSKAASLRAYKACRPRPALAEVLAGIRAQALTEDWTREGGRFVPAMEVWIRRRGWDSSNGNEALPLDTWAHLRNPAQQLRPRPVDDCTCAPGCRPHERCQACLNRRKRNAPNP